MRPSQVSGEAKVSEGRRVGVKGREEFCHIGQTVVIFGSQRQGAEVSQGGYPNSVEVPPAVHTTGSVTWCVYELSAYIHQTEGLEIGVVGEDGLDHIRSQFRIPDPLELSERSKFWEGGAEDT